MKSILITGATGFVGRSVCQLLLKRGDRLTAALRSDSGISRIPATVRGTVGGEIGPQTCWEPAFSHGQINAVVHLAARVHVMRETSNDPAHDFDQVNVAGTETLARAAAKAGVRRFVYISSYHAMTTHSDIALTEQDPCHPTTPYGISKLKGELALKEVCRECDMEFVVLRSPPVYGPGQLGNMKRIFRAVHQGWPLPFGRIKSYRSVVFVENLASAIVACLDHPNAGNETFLVNDGENVSVEQLLRRFGRSSGRKARLIPVPYLMFALAGKMLGKSKQVERFLCPIFADDRKIRTQLEWDPPVTLDDGLTITANWIKDAA